VSVASRWAGFQSTVWATKEALAMPSVVWMGLIGSSTQPRGWVLDRAPFVEVGEVWFLVRP
jgi:hypothetical protein